MSRQFIFSLPLLALIGPAWAAGCDYDIAPFDSERVEIEVTIRCAAGVGRMLAGTSGPTTLEIDRRAVEVSGGGWPVGADAFSARYRIAPATRAARTDGTASATLDAWLVRPEGRDAVLRLYPRSRSDFIIALPLPLRAGVSTIRSGLVPFVGYTAFGALVEREIGLPGPGAFDWDPAVAPARLRVVRLGGSLALTDTQLFRWIEGAGLAVARFWRGFPAAEALLVIQPMAGRGNVVFGRVVPGGGISILLQVGEHAGARAVLDDWILIHELTHVASPFVPGAAWLMEGLATYLEPLARARAGWLTPAAVWAEFVNNMPHGLPAMAGSGLDGSGRAGTYWGGALFMMLADVELRRASEGRQGLEDCLVAVLRHGGNATQRWSPDAFIQACDAAAGAPVLARLAAHHRRSGSPIDLDGIWAMLGIVPDGRSVRFVDAADTWLREAILWGRPNGPPLALPGLIE